MIKINRSRRRMLGRGVQPETRSPIRHSLRPAGCDRRGSTGSTGQGGPSYSSRGCWQRRPYRSPDVVVGVVWCGLFVEEMTRESRQARYLEILIGGKESAKGGKFSRPPLVNLRYQWYRCWCRLDGATPNRATIARESGACNSAITTKIRLASTANKKSQQTLFPKKMRRGQKSRAPCRRMVPANGTRLSNPASHIVGTHGFREKKP